MSEPNVFATALLVVGTITGFVAGFGFAVFYTACQ
jgi:hypothetical protein